MITELRARMREFTDVRKGKNVVYGVEGVGMAALLLSLNLLAFLFHTVLDLVDERYQKIRQILVRHKTFFHDLDALTRYLVFDSWDRLFDFMLTNLKLNTS